MQYRIECIQTIFGHERERRLKLAFDTIWGFRRRKTVFRRKSSKTHSDKSLEITMSTDHARLEPEE